MGDARSYLALGLPERRPARWVQCGPATRRQSVSSKQQRSAGPGGPAHRTAARACACARDRDSGEGEWGGKQIHTPVRAPAQRRWCEARENCCCATASPPRRTAKRAERAGRRAGAPGAAARPEGNTAAHLQAGQARPPRSPRHASRPHPAHGSTRSFRPAPPASTRSPRWTGGAGRPRAAVWADLAEDAGRARSAGRAGEERAITEDVVAPLEALEAEVQRDVGEGEFSCAASPPQISPCVSKFPRASPTHVSSRDERSRAVESGETSAGRSGTQGETPTDLRADAARAAHADPAQSNATGQCNR